MQKYIKYLSLALVVCFLVPQIALASWWNPLSYGWVNRIFHFQQIEKKQDQDIKKKDQQSSSGESAIKITIITPNGGEKISSDSKNQYNIKWSILGISDLKNYYVKLYLIKDKNVLGRISNSASGAGDFVYNWNWIGTGSYLDSSMNLKNASTGDNYKIKAELYKVGNVDKITEDYSDNNFSIVNNGQVNSDKKNSNSGTSLSNPVDCYSFSGAWRQDCILKTKTEDAVIKKDLSLCEGFSDLFSKDFCYSKMGITLNDVTICEKINDKSVKKSNENSLYDSCYSGIAKNLNSENLCGYIKNNESADICYTEVSKGKKDISICEKIKGKDIEGDFYYNQCLNQILNQKTDLKCSSSFDWCSKMMGSGAKNNCYSFCAENKKDAIFCEKISIPDNDNGNTVDDNKANENDQKDQCYEALARITKNINLCFNIVPTKFGPIGRDRKADCIQAVNKLINK